MMKLMPVDQFRPEDLKTPPIQAGNEIEAAVDAIIADVRARGDEALREYARRFDRAEINSVTVSQEEMDEAFSACDPAFWRCFGGPGTISRLSISARCATA